MSLTQLLIKTAYLGKLNIHCLPFMWEIHWHEFNSELRRIRRRRSRRWGKFSCKQKQRKLLLLLHVFWQANIKNVFKQFCCRPTTSPLTSTNHVRCSHDTEIFRKLYSTARLWQGLNRHQQQQQRGVRCPHWTHLCLTREERNMCECAEERESEWMCLWWEKERDVVNERTNEWALVCIANSSLKTEYWVRSKKDRYIERKSLMFMCSRNVLHMWRCVGTIVREQIQHWWHNFFEFFSVLL